MAGGAGLLLPPPPARRAAPAATDPSPPATRVARGGVRGESHSPSSTRSAYRSSALDGQPAPPLTSVSGLAPPQHPPEVRPSGRRKEGGRGAPRGSRAGPGLPRLRSRGTWGQGRCEGCGLAEGGKGGLGPLLSSSATPTAGVGQCALPGASPRQYKISEVKVTFFFIRMSKAQMG